MVITNPQQLAGRLADHFAMLADTGRMVLAAIDAGEIEQARALVAGMVESMERDAQGARMAVQARPRHLPFPPLRM